MITRWTWPFLMASSTLGRPWVSLFNLLGLDAALLQKGGGAAGGQDGEAHARELPGHVHDGTFVVVHDADQHRA